MADPNRAKYKKMFADEFKTAEEYLLPLYGGELIWVDADYECFHYKVDNVRLIFYPHKTGQGHIHIRIRNGGGKNKERGQAIIEAMNLDFDSDSTFHQKNNHCANWYSDNEKKKNEIRKLAKKG